MNLIMHPNKRAGEKLLVAVSEVFDLPLQTVLEWGELLPESDEKTQQRRHLGHIYELLTEGRQNQLMEFALFLLTVQKRDD